MICSPVQCKTETDPAGSTLVWDFSPCARQRRLSRLKPAAPTVERASSGDQVKRDDAAPGAGLGTWYEDSGGFGTTG